MARKRGGRYTMTMIRLPAALEKKLTRIFPLAKQREQFVVQVLTDALSEQMPSEMRKEPAAIGGTLHLFTDGGSRGNPGQAAIGCVLLDPLSGKILKEHCETIGIQTNNIAEYLALIAGLKMAMEFCPNRLICHLDSELVVKQLSGEYRVKMPTFQPLIDEIMQRKAECKNVQFVTIPRAQNARADALVNRALDGK